MTADDGRRWLYVYANGRYCGKVWASADELAMALGHRAFIIAPNGETTIYRRPRD